MLIQNFFSLISPILIGIFIVNYSLGSYTKVPFLMKLILGTGIGIGITSCLFFFWSFFFSPLDKQYLYIEILLCFILAIPIALKLVKRNSTLPLAIFKEKKLTNVFPKFSFEKALTILKSPINQLICFSFFTLITITILSLINLNSYAREAPHGYYDAWSIWNLHARMIFRGGAFWKNGFTADLYHADYPLLIPMSIARNWAIIGRETIRTPLIISFIFTGVTAALLYFGVKSNKSRLQALISTIILVSTPWFIKLTAYQYADIPLAFYILATCILIYIWQLEKNNLKPVFLIGLCTGLAAWTKNEGLLFLGTIMLFSIILLMKNRDMIFTKQYLLRLLCGLLLPLIAIIVFKIKIAPANDLISDWNPALIISNITDLNRYFTVSINAIKILGNTLRFPMIFGLIIYILIMKEKTLNQFVKNGIYSLSMILIFMFIGYLGIYILTPWDPAVHMRTSADRVFFHLYPSVLFLISTFVIAPEEKFTKYNPIKRSNTENVTDN